MVFWRKMAFWRKSADGADAPQQLYKNLKMSAANPNMAKWYAWGLVCCAAFIALLTFRSNFEYFLHYYFGWGLKTRVTVFWGVEAFLILAPLSKGYGNAEQIRWAFRFEAALIPLLFLHTYLVGEWTETRKEATETKIAATADLSREREAAEKVAQQNQKSQDSFNLSQRNYNAALWRYERLKRQALRDGTSMPSMPVAPPQPQLVPVPKINEGLVSNSTMAVADVVQSKVDHNTLRALQFLILLCAVAGTATIVVLSDAMKVRGWFMKHRQDDLNNAMQSQSPYNTIGQRTQSVIAVPLGGQALTHRLAQTPPPPGPSQGSRPRYRGRLGKP
jgi:hypothetical protein